MALARVVAFEGVTSDRIERLREQVEASGGPPADVPASELLILHDPRTEKSLAIVVFESEDDYERGGAALDAMPADETPGRRASVDRYEVAVRVSA